MNKYVHFCLQKSHQVLNTHIANNLYHLLEISTLRPVKIRAYINQPMFFFLLLIQRSYAC